MFLGSGKLRILWLWGPRLVDDLVAHNILISADSATLLLGCLQGVNLDQFHHTVDLIAFPRHRSVHHSLRNTAVRKGFGESYKLAGGINIPRKGHAVLPYFPAEVLTVQLTKPA